MLTTDEVRRLEVSGYVGSAGPLMWTYFSLLLGRDLTIAEREYVRVRILGWKPDYARKARLEEENHVA